MGGFWRRVRETIGLLFRIPLRYQIPALLLAALAGVGTVWLTDSITRGVAVGAAALFAVLAAATLGMIVVMIFEDKVWSWGFAALTVAVLWLAHPLVLLPLPTLAALLATPLSIAASLTLFAFAAGGIEAAARP